jgi:hypothetical protein
MRSANPHMIPLRGAPVPPCRIARVGTSNRPTRPPIAFWGRKVASGEAERTRFGTYYRISFRSNRGDPEKPSLQPLPDTTGMVSKIPRFSAIFGDGMRTLANCHCDAKIPMAIG